MADIWFQQSISSAFLEAFRRCDPAADGGTSRHLMAFPAVVCAAFSAEVGLKTLLEMQEIPARGHDLRALFLKLPDAQKTAVFEATMLSADEFGAQLAHSRLAFSEWRYIYEDLGEKSINVRFLGVFATAVEKVVIQEGARREAR